MKPKPTNDLLEGLESLKLISGTFSHHVYYEVERDEAVALLAHISSLERDRARLDWLETQTEYVLESRREQRGLWCLWNDEDGPDISDPSLRGVIDKATKEKPFA